MDAGKQQSEIIAALLNPELSGAIFPHEVTKLDLIETHISWVVLTGLYAYKIKKNVDFGFLDFSTLSKREYFCQEELRINRRYAETLYLDVVAITGSVDILPVSLSINGNGDAIEYAVRMKEFSQHDLFDNCLKRNEVKTSHFDCLAVQLANFHASAAASKKANGLPYGSYTSISASVMENFQQIRLFDCYVGVEQVLDELQAWTEKKLTTLVPTFELRKKQGFIRECHGDLHLNNIAMIDGEITFFDGIEFNDQLRWIDTQSELAYPLMDLEYNGYATKANRLLNRYLEFSGDYQGLAVLRFYKVYRAIVRAKINGLRLAQDHLNVDEKRNSQSLFGHYLTLAQRYIADVCPRWVDSSLKEFFFHGPFLAIMHGVSGTGKTTLSESIIEQCGAVRIRSDVERKRLHGLEPTANSHSDVDKGIYTVEATQLTYNSIADTAEKIIRNGYAVVVDATFLSRPLRDQFRALAKELDVPFVILDCLADEPALIERLQYRSKNVVNVSEADVATMKSQLVSQDHLSKQEQQYCFPLKAENGSADRIFDKVGLSRLFCDQSLS